MHIKRGTAVIASMLAVCAAIPAAATINWSVETVGATKTYHYIYTNTEEPGDIVCGIHVYAPVDASLISGWQADPGWDFDTALDYTGALDIFWYTDFPDTYGASAGQSVHVSLQTSALVETAYGYVLPDFLIGNWGYDTKLTGGAWTMFGSVPVPEGTATVPEPAALLAVIVGCGWIALRRRS